MKSKSQAQWGLILVAVLYANYFAYDNFFRAPPEPHWGNTGETNAARNPASISNPNTTPMNLPELDVYEDFFLHDTFNGYVQYDMDVDFWSDKGANYFKKHGKKALEEGLKKSFVKIVENANKEINLPATAKDYVIKETLNEFVYTIRAHKLLDANFELDFKFTPKNNNFSDFNSELSSNQLVLLENKGSLLKEINDYGKSLPESVLKAKIPNTGHMYQYMGGAITVAAEILDTSWKITNPIPKPKKNALKGFVRLRKYYRVNQPGVLELSAFNSKNLKLTNTHFKKVPGHEKPMITVDTIYSYNLEDIVPKKEKIIIHYGKLASLDKKHDNLIKRVFTIFNKSNDIKTAAFYIEGQTKIKNIPTLFKTRIDSIVYDVKKGKIVRDSVLNTSYKSGAVSANRLLVEKELLEKQEQLFELLKLQPLIDSKKI